MAISLNPLDCTEVVTIQHAAQDSAVRQQAIRKDLFAV
jgi:hypothetical protein